MTTNRSFTGHESIEDSNGLVHMNGKVYDNSIGRFISADPFIQAPHNSQSYNRYTYVMNNPINATDPNGYWSIDLGIIKVGNHGTSNGFATRALLRNQTARLIVGTFIMANFGPYGAAAYSTYLTKAGGGSWGDAINSGAITIATAWIASGIANQVGEAYAPAGSTIEAHKNWYWKRSIFSWVCK